MTELRPVKKYIVEIEDDEGDFEEIFVGYIRKQKELITCEHCIHFGGYYCHNKKWGDGWGSYPAPDKSYDGFCDWAEKESEA